MSPTDRPLPRAWRAVWPAALAFGAVEAFAAGAPLPALVRLGYLLPVWGALAVVATLGVAALAPALAALPRWARGSVAPAFTVGAAFEVARLAGGVGNHDLLAAAVGMAALGGLAAGLALARPIDVLPAPTRRAAHFTAVGVVAARIALTNRAAIDVLGPAFVLAPLAALAVFLVARRPRPRAVGLVGAVLAVAFLGFGMVGSAPRAIVADGGWGAFVVRGARALADRDGDGHAHVFGGADCAPDDPARHPDAVDVPGDGVDQDCDGVDAPASAWPAPAWDPALAGKARDLIVVTVEALRPDVVGFLGCPLPTTPNLDALAAEAVVFERAYASSSATMIALPAFWAGVLPSGVRFGEKTGRYRPIDPTTPWLPATLQAAGFRTVAVVVDYDGFRADAGAGFDRGFDVFDRDLPAGQRSGAFHGFPSAEVVDRALAHVDRAGDARLLLWVHLVEPHAAYEQPPGAPVFGEQDRHRYAAEVHHVDAQLARLIEGLRARGRWDDAALLVVGDHGEAFGEHGVRFHGSRLHEAQVRTAALLRAPGVPGRRVEAPVQHADLIATAQNLLGVRAGFDRLEGRNLAPALRGEPLPRPEVVLELFQQATGRLYNGAVVRWPLKLLHAPWSEETVLYDLAADPGETTDLSASRPADVEALMRVLRAARAPR